MKKLFTILIAFTLLFICSQSNAGRVGFHVGTNGVGFGYHGSHSNIYVGTPYSYSYAPAYRYHEYRAPYRSYIQGGIGYHNGYYPRYWNPVEHRDIRYRENFDRRGNVHSESTVEDRHSSYYSPGRNEAITPPQRTIRRDWRGNEIDRTTWIGADGQPHSTTIRQETRQDRWGNTHTDTHVDLKNKAEAVAPIEKQQPATKLMPKPKMPKTEVKTPND